VKSTKIFTLKLWVGVIGVILMTTGSNVYAESPYDSGFEHGCNDAQIEDSDDWYINQPGKGKTYHTQGFVNGYDAGFSDCQDHSDYDPYDCSYGSKGCNGIPYCSYDDSDTCYDDGDSALFGN